MAQKRYTDRGRPYDHEAWRALYRNTFSPGVYSGFSLSPSITSASQVVVAPGALMLPTGIVVVEDSEVTIQMSGTFPPSLATTYTLFTMHSEAAVGLIGGEAMTYGSIASELTEQPDDGVILGWIRHPGGSVALAQSHITNAPKYAPSIVAQDAVARRPISVSAPNLVTTLGQGVSLTSGYETNRAWRGFTNPSTAIDAGTGLTPVATSYFQFPIYARPYEFRLRSVIPIGDQIAVDILDTAGVSITTSTLSAHATFTENTVSVPSTGGTFTTGAMATVKLTSTVSQGTIVKLADLTIDFWPYGFGQF